MTNCVCNFWNPNVHSEMLLTLDQHKVQSYYISYHTSWLHQFSSAVVFNGSFKKAVDNLATAHMEKSYQVITSVEILLPVIIRFY